MFRFKRKSIEWEAFIEQHDGIQLLKDIYNLTDREIQNACIKGIQELISKSAADSTETAQRLKDARL